jgi:hypothetical protein
MAAVTRMLGRPNPTTRATTLTRWLAMNTLVTTPAPRRPGGPSVGATRATNHQPGTTTRNGHAARTARGGRYAETSRTPNAIATTRIERGFVMILTSAVSALLASDGAAR